MSDSLLLSGSSSAVSLEMSQPQRERRFDDDDAIEQSDLNPNTSKLNTESKTEAGFDVLDGKFLFDIIVESKASFNDIVDSWIENYIIDDTKAIISLIQLILLASNNRLTLTPEMFQKNSFPELYDEITKNFINEEIYPLISENVSSFGSSFREFVYKLSKASRFTFINNDDMMNNICSFLKLSCASSYRPLRHTATYFGLIFATGILYNIANLAENLSKIASQEGAGSEILSSSFSQKERSEEKIMKNHFGFLFKEVYSTRYRDVSPEIRALCINELGYWMLIYPREIIKDSKLKYIGWLLHDKNANVRLQCFKAIQPLLEKEVSINLLDNFLNKFKSRIIQMVNDVNDEVCCEALQALNCISKFRPEFIDKESVKKIASLVKSANKKISSLSVALMLEINKFKVKKLPTPQESIEFLKIVTDCISDSCDLQNVLLVVDAFAKYSVYMTSWGSYIHFLLDYEHEEENQEFEYLFICLFYASILYFIDSKFPMERQQRKNIQTEITNKALEEKAKFTASIMDSYKSLFNKYCGEKEKALILVGFAQYFDVKILLSNVQNQSFVEEVAILMQNLILKSFEKEFLVTCIKSLYFLCMNHAEHTQSEDLKQKLISKIVNNLLNLLRESMSTFVNKNQSESLDTINQITGILSLFMSYFDLRDSAVGDNIDVLIGAADAQDEKNCELIENLFSCKASLIMAKCSSYPSDKLLKQSGEAKKMASELLDEILMLQEYAHQIFSHQNGQIDNVFKELCMMITKVAEKELSESFFQAPGFQNNLLRLNELMLQYLHKHVFIHKATNTKQDNNRQEIVMSYCTLLMKQIISVNDFKHILRYFSSHQYLSEIIKYVLVELKAFNLKKLCQIISETFILCFEECKPADGHEFNKFSSQFIKIKELSKKIVLQFGIQGAQRKNSLLLVQKLIIDYFVRNANLSSSSQDYNAYILDTLTPFHSRTSTSDQKMLLMYLNDRVGSNFDHVARMWPCVSNYLGLKVQNVDGEDGTDRASMVDIEE